MTTQPLTQQATEIIDAVENTLINMALYDIHRALGKRPPRQKLIRTTQLQEGIHPFPAAFLLGCCLIETAGHFLIGPPPTGYTGDSQQAFETFADIYLKPKGYEPVTLYKAMRCGLAHNYTTASNRFSFKQSYKLVHTARAFHLQPHATNPDIRYLNLQDFIVDIEEAIKKFINTDVRGNQNNAQERFLAWAEDSGWLSASYNPLPATTIATIVATTPTPPNRAASAQCSNSWRSAMPNSQTATWNWGGVQPPTITQEQLDLVDPKLINKINNGGIETHQVLCMTATGTGNPQTEGIAPTIYAPMATFDDKVNLPQGLILPKGYGLPKTLSGSKTQRKAERSRLNKMVRKT